jgi:hypothetical protein
MTEQQREDNYKKQQKELIRILDFLVSIGKDFKVSQNECSGPHEYSDTSYGLSYYIDIDDKITFELNDDCYVVITSKKAEDEVV